MDGARPARKRSSRILACVSAALLAVFLGMPGEANAQTPRTVVTFTVDDGSVSQTSGARILSKHGMRGTFYVVSGSIGTRGYLSLDDLRSLAAAGHEIGGHTVNHPDLAEGAPDEARREICQDRANLVAWGFRPTSFAYPFGSFSREAERAAADCGYNSARVTGSLRTKNSCSDCAPAESIPPVNPLVVRGTDTVTPDWTLADLQQVVLRAEASGGGWVPLVLHQTCDFCGSLSISPAVLDQFASWLAQRQANGTVVRTVDQVIGGGFRPLVRPPASAPRDGLVNASLEEPGPRGWVQSSWGQNNPQWTRVSDAHDGHWAQRLDITEYAGGEAKLLQQLDMGEAAPAAHPNNTYELSAWYKSTAPTQLAVYRRDQAGAWRYWTTSPWFAASANWASAAWTTPAAPDGTTGLSFGLTLTRAGSLTTDDYRLQEHVRPKAEAVCARLPWTYLLRWLC
ncbi:Polysaccharide deacetylase [Saccharopolyspora shandongensis]|uniref:Polysaccharide deacetylase n=1 Tax=Saccharopolyspora shandongensis TaxID=418495 RepID=A0A1H3AKS1_9PSEU|nr:polysaccharide deacetylase family protein [Saccharopolyspora shandongensis]SDX30310.1 Polysaccharide deacetylase [Saccharopolyspora shandongensis]